MDIYGFSIDSIENEDEQLDEQLDFGVPIDKHSLYAAHTVAWNDMKLLMSSSKAHQSPRDDFLVPRSMFHAEDQCTDIFSTNGNALQQSEHHQKRRREPAHMSIGGKTSNEKGGAHPWQSLNCWKLKPYISQLLILPTWDM